MATNSANLPPEAELPGEPGLTGRPGRMERVPQIEDESADLLATPVAVGGNIILISEISIQNEYHTKLMRTPREAGSIVPYDN